MLYSFIKFAQMYSALLSFLLYTFSGRLILSLVGAFVLLCLILLLLKGFCLLMTAVIALPVRICAASKNMMSEETHFEPDSNREELFEEFFEYDQTAKARTQETINPSSYEILGVKTTATAQEIKQAYHRHLNLYHPDRVATMSPEIQNLANDLTRKVKDAYETLIK